MKTIHTIAFAVLLSACSGGVSSVLYIPQDGGSDAGESAESADGGAGVGISTTGGTSASQGGANMGDPGEGSGSGTGTPGSGGGGSTNENGGGSSTNGNGGGGGVSATGGSCGVALGTGNAACDCCVAEACTPDDAACANDGPCVAAIACVKECNGYEACVQDCEFDNPSSQAEMLLSCLQFSCMSSCGGFYGEL